jgi:hypothetical protein
MINVFLSASVPLPDRNEQFSQTADVIAIREAVKAIVGEVIPRGFLVFGGHPAITPLVARLLRTMGPESRGRFVLYQSAFFSDHFGADNDEFVELRIIPTFRKSRKFSLKKMRERMIGETPFDAGVFIGGMEGVLEEFELFRNMHPNAHVWPIASTGAAARSVFERTASQRPELFVNEMTYPKLFRTLLSEIGGAADSA